LKERRFIGGEAPRKVDYNEAVNYIISDYCTWNSSSHYMNYTGSTGIPNDNKQVNQNGYVFTATLTNKDKYREAITRYAAPGYYIRGHSTYTENGDTFSVSEVAWIGNSNVQNGASYNTSNHYYTGNYVGSYWTNDTRRYKGVYSGTVYNNRPVNSSFGIEEVPFSDYRGYWVNTSKSFVIWAKAYAETLNASYKPNNIYFSLQNPSSGYEYGAIQTNVSSAAYYRQTGSIAIDSQILDRGFTYESNATAYSRLRTKLVKDGTKIKYKFTSSKDYLGYIEASTWKDMYTVNADGKAPTAENIYIDNVTSLGFDVVIKNAYDHNGSGTKYADLYFYYNGQWNVDKQYYRNTYSMSDGQTKVIHLNYADIPKGTNEFGNFTVDVRLYDNVGNGGEVLKSLSAFRNTPTPVSDYINLYNYEYSNGGVYWVKSGDPFTARISGHINNPLSRYGISSEHLIIRQWGASNFNSIQAFDSGIDQYAAINTNQYSASVGTSTFPASKFTLNSGYGVRTSANYTDSVFNIKTDNTLGDFDLSPLIRINTPASGYWDSTWGIPNLRVKSDGIAPKADSVGITKQMVNELNLQINNLTDIGSGLNLEKLYMEVQPVNFSGALVGVKEKSYNYTSLGNNNYSLRIDWNSCQNKTWYGKFKVQVYAFDYVGNSSCIYDKILDRQPLKIQGTIDPNPAQQGKNTGVTIRTEGSANRIKIVFPFEFRNLDSTLFIDKAINVEPSHIELTNARVPLEVPLTLDESGNRLKDKYKVYIEAVNGYGEIVSGYLDLDIQGNILDDLKVRLRGTGYDKE